MDFFNDSNKHKIISKIITTTVNCKKNNLTERSNLNNSRKNSLSNQKDNNNLNNSKNNNDEIEGRENVDGDNDDKEKNNKCNSIKDFKFYNIYKNKTINDYNSNMLFHHK